MWFCLQQNQHLQILNRTEIKKSAVKVSPTGGDLEGADWAPKQLAAQIPVAAVTANKYDGAFG